jgi:hypothetical protein
MQGVWGPRMGIRAARLAESGIAIDYEPTLEGRVRRSREDTCYHNNHNHFQHMAVYRGARAEFLR